MQTLDEAIEQSRRILDWPDDWDGEGSPAYSLDTWERAVAFLREMERQARDRGHSLATPEILPGANGDIDLRWWHGGCLLLTIPADESTPIEYYGQAHGVSDGDITGTMASDDQKESPFMPWIMGRRIYT